MSNYLKLIYNPEILELNQIIGYFNYVNRLLNGLGVTTIGDTVGFYKSTESNLV